MKYVLVPIDSNLKFVENLPVEDFTISPSQDFIITWSDSSIDRMVVASDQLIYYYPNNQNDYQIYKLHENHGSTIC